MIGDGFLAVGRAATGNRVRQRLVHRKPSQPAGFPFAKIIGHRFFFNGFTEKHPRFISAFWRNANFGKFPLGELWPVTTAKAEVKPHDGSSHLVASFNHRVLNQVLEYRMPCHANVRAWHERGPQHFAPFMKNPPKLQLLCVRQNRKSRQRVALAATDCRGESPYATASGAKLGNFFSRKFQNTIRRIGANGMKRARLAFAQPVKTICMVNPIHFLSAKKFNYRRKTIKRKKCINYR